MIPERLRIIAELVPPLPIIVDVGAHHGHLAHAVGAIAVEAAPSCVGRRDVPWIVADGLTALRRVDVVILAGMGARRIAAILDAGPRPRVVVAHPDDDPPDLRRRLSRRGWRIEDERLAAQPGGRIAEIIRFVDGREPASGLWLDYGPVLLRSSEPLLAEHLRRCHARHQRLADTVPVPAAEPHRERAAFLSERLAQLAPAGSALPT